MSDTIDEVAIVGGGDSGLLTALCLQQLNPGVELSVVDDFQRDLPQVGKSTFYKIYEILHGMLDIDRERFIREVKPIWKCSVYFRDWCGCEPFHYPFDDSNKFPDVSTPDAIQVYASLYESEYANTLTIDEEIVAQGKSPWHFDPRTGGYQLYQPIAYHLDTDRFNGFLRNLCRERGISLIDDEVTGADVSDGDVECVRGERGAYEADLYVDASGFDRTLTGQRDGEFRDFGFPLDSAYNTAIDRPLSDVVPATVVESGENGWFWHIDTYDERDLGYVYASAFTSDEAALEEFLDHCDGDVSEEDVAKYRFSSGYAVDPWAGNCLPIGNAGGFVEPLESTGLTFNAEAAIRLSALLSAHGRIADDAIRETYNTWWRRCWESIYDFIAVHYVFAPGDTPFWEAMRSLERSQRVEQIVETFDRHGFDVHVPGEAGIDADPLLVFSLENFYVLVRNLGCTSTFYEENEFVVSDDLERAVEGARAQRAARVEREHITTEEYYRGVLGLD